VGVIVTPILKYPKKIINPHASQLNPINPIDRGIIYKSFTTVTIIDYPPVVKDGN
jgi:hypothetical protein